MPFESLQEKLAEIFGFTGFSSPQKEVLTTLYVQPGIAMPKLKQKVFACDVPHIVDELHEQQLVVLQKQGRSQSVYPIPLALLIERCCTKSIKKCQEAVEKVKSIDKWIKYPVLQKDDAQVKTASDRATMLKWLFELHHSDWEKVFCFGDYESFINGIGVDVEQDWIKERVKKGRKASVVATQDGQWAQGIRKMSTKELRDCTISPQDFSELFIMAFPDIHTTVMGNAQGEVTFVHSAAIARNYTSLVQKSLQQTKAQ